MRGPTAGSSAERAMLIDHYLPLFDVTAIEHLVVGSELDTAWNQVRQFDLMRVHTPLMDAAFFVRGLPSRLSSSSGRARPSAPPPPRLLLSGDGPALEGWLSLGEDPPHEVAFGAIGRFWEPNIDWYDVEAVSPEDFAAFDEPGWGRIAASVSLRDYGVSRTLVSYEARTATPDAISAKKFGRYWTLAHPFVGHIMRATLTTLRDEVEQRTAARSR